MPTLADNRYAPVKNPLPRKVGALLLCAGYGKRLGIGTHKALVPLAGKALFLWSLEALESTPDVHGVVIVGPIQPLQAAIRPAQFKFVKIVGWCEGGRTRQKSVVIGLKALPAEFTVVAVHDCARAMVSVNLISRVIGDAFKHGAAIAAIPLNDTLKQVVGQTISTTISRTDLWRAQTPQVFRRDWLEVAYAHASDQATDDATLVEALGHSVFITAGESHNFKITTSQDLDLAERYLENRPIALNRQTSKSPNR